jgi:hypothetical protein
MLVDDDSVQRAAQQLPDLRRVDTTATPSTAGAIEAAQAQGGANAARQGNPVSARSCHCRAEGAASVSHAGHRGGGRFTQKRCGRE